MGWGVLNLVIGGIVSVLPLPILPFVPEQSVTHYGAHVVYTRRADPPGRARLPSVAHRTRGGSFLRSVRATTRCSRTDGSPGSGPTRMTSATAFGRGTGDPHRIATRVGSLAVRVRGDGRPAVLWHSLFVDERSWQRVEDELARDRRLVIITGPGHGDEHRPRPSLLARRLCGGGR